jgi:hypothetical protein
LALLVLGFLLPGRVEQHFLYGAGVLLTVIVPLVRNSGEMPVFARQWRSVVAVALCAYVGSLFISIPPSGLSVSVVATLNEGGVPLTYIPGDIPKSIESHPMDGPTFGRGTGAAAEKATAVASVASAGAATNAAEPEPVEALPTITGTASVVVPAAIALGTGYTTSPIDPIG